MSFDTEQEIRKHYIKLKNNYHTNDAMQEDFNHYGMVSFKFTIIQRFNSKQFKELSITKQYDKLKERRNYWRKSLKTSQINAGYNKPANKRQQQKFPTPLEP